jgi:Zn-dependent protease
MFSSLRLGKWFGIDVYVHATFWLLPLFVLLEDVSKVYGAADTVMDLALVLAVFACVVLHEFGHALTARAYGIRTRHITLYPIGGVAALERIPTKPLQEIAVTLAGPAVNLVIAAGLFAGLVLGANLLPVEHNPLFWLAGRLMWANVILFGFNLLPAFPMDGGRLLRALLALRMNRVRATELAVGVGTVVAGGMVVAGVLLPSASLIFVAATVFLLGRAELAMVRARERGRGIGEWVREAAAPRPSPEAAGPPSPGFSGLAWDAARGVWVEWRNGVRVGALPPVS